MSAFSFSPRLAAAALAAAATMLAGRADADDGVRLRVQWGKLADVIRDGGASLLPLNLEWPPQSEGRLGEGRLASGAPSPDVRWLGASPHVSVVARDWGSAQIVVGHLSLTDQSRLTRSSRMFITRVRIADGRLAPFAQAGLGQWRIDADLLPSLPRDVELAAQLGGGFELAVARLATLALEADYTVLYREQHEPQMVCGPHLWGAFLAGRMRF
jgi:hypothetical protein